MWSWETKTALELLHAQATIADSIDWTWSSRDMYINWNELQHLACATSKLQQVATSATRSVVVPYNLYQNKGNVGVAEQQKAWRQCRNDSIKQRIHTCTVTSGMQDIRGRAWAKCMRVQDMQGAGAFTLSSECDRAISTEIMALLKHTLVHIAANVSQVSIYS